MTRTRPARIPPPAPVNIRLYALCREGTDPAITRALEEAMDPWARIKKLAQENIDWGMVDDITTNLMNARCTCARIDGEPDGFSIDGLCPIHGLLVE